LSASGQWDSTSTPAAYGATISSITFTC
jgi:hypothetical protein